jgi:hypothetical protein
MESQLHWNRSGELSSGEEQRECHDGVPSQLHEEKRRFRNIGVDDAIRLAVVIIRLDSDSGGGLLVASATSDRTNAISDVAREHLSRHRQLGISFEHLERLQRVAD